MQSSKMPPRYSDAIFVYRASSIVEAHALALHLAGAGIEARVLGDPLQGAYAGITLGSMNMPEVWVAERFRSEAQPIISAWQKEHAPADAADRFQFPLGLVFMAMAYVAAVLGLLKMNPLAQDIFVTLLHLALFALVGFVGWRKLLAHRTMKEDD